VAGLAAGLTHDVDTIRGLQRCRELMRMEKALGLVSSFNFVPEKRYRLPGELRAELIGNGFEVGVHGLNHDGKLFSTRTVFDQQYPKINGYIRAWASVGFRAPAMHHNLSWLHDLDVSYDASTFDTDPFEPQPDGLQTIFPAVVRRHHDGHEYVELPYTMPQDFTLYILLQEREPQIWKRKLAWLVEQGGMVLMNTHPDYMCFNGQPGLEEYRAELYRDFIAYVQKTYAGQYWHALPREVAAFVADNRDKVTTVLTDQ
jgi:hypothetical protein